MISVYVFFKGSQKLDDDTKLIWQLGKRFDEASGLGAKDTFLGVESSYERFVGREVVTPFFVYGTGKFGSGGQFVAFESFGLPLDSILALAS